MTNENPSAMHNLSRRVDRYLAVIGILMLFGLILTVVFYSLSSQEIIDIGLIDQEMQTHSISEQNLAELNRYVDQESQRVEQIFTTFPTEQDILFVLEDIETVVKRYDPEARVGFSAEQPTKVQNEMQIPLRISLNASLQDLVLLLRELEKLPIILETSAVEIMNTDTERLAITMGASLYVNDPFIEPQQNP